MADGTDRRRVLLTGATGYVAGQLLPELRARYDLTLVDVKTSTRDGDAVDDVTLCDPLAEPERFAELCAGVDTFVHCGHVRPGGAGGHPGAGLAYEAERANVDLAERVYETAASVGARRVVCASTNQASKWYEQPWYAGRRDRVDPFDYPRPDSFYGWAKVAFESLGFLHACGSLGHTVPNVQIRIVAPRPISAAAFADRPLQHYLRDIAGWVSPRDLAQLFVRSIEAESIDDADGVPFQIFYGVSGNARTFWSIANARQVVGYAPRDDSEIEFGDEIAAMTGGTTAGR